MYGTVQLKVGTVFYKPELQGYNARKFISDVYACFVLQCTVYGGNVNTSLMSQPDMGFIFHIKFNAPRILNEH